MRDGTTREIPLYQEAKNGPESIAKIFLEYAANYGMRDWMERIQLYHAVNPGVQILLSKAYRGPHL